MKNDLALKNLAKKLVQLSIEEGQISANRVEAVLKVIKSKYPRQQAALLKHYSLFVRREIRHRQARVEYAGKLEASTVKQLQQHLSSHYNRPLTLTTHENPALIAGLRITVGDDVYDSTAAHRLKALSSASLTAN